MKTKKWIKSMKWAIVCGVSMLAMAACSHDGSVPDAYRGTFQNSSGVQLTLSDSNATLQVNGKTIQGAVAPIDYNKLSQGQAGYYIDQIKNDSVMDVYWITPNASTRQENGGLIYYTTDIVYMKIDLNQKNPVPAITLVHAADGEVMIDTQSKTWQAGWPAHADQYDLVRANSSKPN